MKGVAVVLGAGRGVRLGKSLPKATVRVAGRTLLEWSASALGRARGVDAVLPVTAAGGEATFAALRAAWAGPAALLEPVLGGETRQASLAAGLHALAGRTPDAVFVLVHDAARCLVEPRDAERVLELARETGAAIPVIPLADTLKEVVQGRVVRTADRSHLVAAQTPQVFRLAVLREALEKAQREGFLGTDCASLVERLGVQVCTCPGRLENFKITDEADLERAALRLRARGGP